MMPDKARRVHAMFAAISRSYDLNNRIHSFGLDQQWRRRAVRLCDVRPTDDVLDVACGTGDFTQAFAEAGAKSVTGLDFCEPMVAIARSKSQSSWRRNGQAVPSYVVGDAVNLPFEDGSFDIVSIAFGIRNVSDPAAALCEFRRVLRGGGQLAVLEFSQPRNPILRRLHEYYTQRVMPRTASILSADRSGAYLYLPRSVTTFPKPEQFISLLERFGFGHVAVHPMTFGVCTAYLAGAPR